MKQPTKRNQSDEKLSEMRKRYDRAREYWDPVFDAARDDIRFVVVPGNQWTADLKSKRKNRHFYEFPKLRGQTQQIINEQKQSRPAAKIRGVEEADRSLADIMQGIIYNIDSVSNAERARDIAFEPAVRGGVGFYRICTDYANQDDFNLDIYVRPIRNFSGAYCDPAATEIDRRDSNFWFVPESMSDDDFERRFPNASKQDFYDNIDCQKWRDAGRITVAEYWYKEPYKRKLLLLATGEVVEDKPGLEDAIAASGGTVIRVRDVDCHRVYSVLTNGHEFLNDPVEFPSKFIPIIPVFGNIDNIDGEDYISGAVRFGKDSQRLHNIQRTAAIEALAKAPKAPFIGPKSAFQGLEHQWNHANSEDFAFLAYNDDATAPPQRSRQAELPAALFQASDIAHEDMKEATGVPDTARGLKSNEASGAAQRERKLSSATATFNYLDNLIHAIRFETEIKLDMIPRVYDTPRVVRTLGQDGGEKWVQLYRQVQDPETGQLITLNDISKGKYDFTVTAGPSYATQRMEAAQAYANMAGQVGAAVPELSAFLAYLVAKHTDSPDSEMAETVFRRILLAKGVPLEPKDGDPPPPKPQPNPRDMAAAERDKAQAEKTSAETEGIRLKNMTDATMIGYDMGVSGIPIPQSQESQPPQGGFFMPEEGLGLGQTTG